MKIKELIFEEQDIPDSSRGITCLQEKGFASLEEEANCLKEIGVDSFEINHIITLRFREEEIIKN
jgi:hypothetical protein|tara:strand:+ start:568 stop:762 length:195 start_codon:yes stop_codon:yes gene_type:complete